jgi:hypothetical protein
LSGIIRDLYAVAWLATWGNNMAWLESLAVAGAVTFLLRHRIGRNLAAWWDRHHGPKAVERHKQALREHEAAKREGGAS